MSTLNKTNLEISVVHVDRYPIQNLKIVVPGFQARQMGEGRFLLQGVPKGRLKIRVEAEGLAPVDTLIVVQDDKQRIDVVLGEPGLPTFSRKGVPVPFRSPENILGVITRGKEGAAVLKEYAYKNKLKIESPHGRDLTMLELPAGQIEAVAKELRNLPNVKEVGRLVNPGVRGTGMLTRNIIVQSVENAPAEDIKAAAEKAGCTVARKLVFKDRWLCVLNDGEGFSVLEAAKKMENDTAVLSAEPDIAFTAEPDVVNPDDQLYGNQWHLSRVNAPAAWQNLRDANAAGVNPGDPGDLTYGSADILLAVMDTGVKSTTDMGGNVIAEHPEFQGNISNGQSKVAAFFDFGAMVPNCADPMAVFGDGYHGSACAGVATAKANNASSVAGEDEGGSGAAPNCRLLAVQGPNPCTEVEYSDMYLWIAGIDPGSADPAFPVQLAHGADVITNSWGGYNPATWPISSLMDTLFTTITDTARNGRGTLMFFSAGNAFSANFWTMRPFAAHTRNFGIAASTDADVKADYSNWGDGIDLTAPSSGGVLGITTTTIPGLGTEAGHTGGGSDYISDFGGTSSATPLTAGVAALLLSMDPTLTHGESRTILERTAKRIDYANTDADGQWRDVDGDGVKEYSSWYGFGMIDAARAVCVARNTLSVDPSINFVDIPELEPAIRPVTIRLKGWRPRSFQITTGPNTTTGPAGSFQLHAGATVNFSGSFDCAETHVHIWIRYTGTADGDVALGDLIVTCNETGQTFNVTLSANTVLRQKTALVLSLDRSGSMNDPAGDGRLKIDLVRDSAAVVPVLCDSATGLGAVSWDTDADIAGAMAVQDAGPEMGGAGRNALSTFIANHNTNIFGATAIGDGVEAAQSLLNASVGYTLPAMCLLTDGNETAPKYLSDLAASELHSRIFAIGVGTPENINPAALATIAGSNDGFLLMTGTIGPDDSFLLTKYFQQILAGITNTEIVVDPQGWLTPGAPKLRLPFPVNETDRQVDVIVHCRVPWLLHFTIEAPDGQVFGPAQANGIDVRYVTGAGSAYYRFDLPSSVVGQQDPAAQWYAHIGIDAKAWKDYITRLKSGDLPAGTNAQASLRSAIHGLRYAFTTQARSSLRMDVNVTQSNRQPGATAWLQATILEYGYPLQAPAKVWAAITDPKGGVTQLELNYAGNSIYKANMIANITGAWRITIFAAGKTSKGSPFKREAIRSVVVWPDGDKPGPHSTPENPGNHIMDCLCSKGVIDKELAKKLGIDLERLCSCIKKKNR